MNVAFPVSLNQTSTNAIDIEDNDGKVLCCISTDLDDVTEEHWELAYFIIDAMNEKFVADNTNTKDL